MSAKKTTSERIAAARAEQTALAVQITATEEQRRAALIADDDAGATRADVRLGKLRLALQRVADKIELLSGLAAAADQAARNWPPQDLETARTRLDEMQGRQRALQRRPLADRSAADDEEADSLANRIPALVNHIALLERMEAAR